jgi:Domain of unknown function (DUF4145)
MTFPGHGAIKYHDPSTSDAWHGYICGHCGSKVVGVVVASAEWREPFGLGSQVSRQVIWLQCPGCGNGSAYSNGRMFPNVAFGAKIEGLPDNVAELYDEIRRSMQASAYNGAELLCRKLLMHVAVEKGAAAGLTFVECVTSLENSGYVTPPMKNWVDRIRLHGNQAAHEISAPDKERAESTVMFTVELLRLIYEMEHFSAQYGPPKPSAP